MDTPETIIARLERLPFLPSHWKIASILGVGTLFDAFDSVTIGIVLTVIAITFKVTFVTAGLLISGGYVGQFVGALFFGVIAERFGRKWAFVLSLAIFGVCSLIAALASDFNTLLVCRVLQGIGLGAEVPIAGALFNEFVRGRTRGKVVMAYESAFNWGLLAAPLVAAPLIATLGPAHGWRAMFLLGALPLVVAAIAWRSLPESPRWLAAHGRVAEASAIIDAFEAEARTRGADLPQLPAVPSPAAQPTSFAELFSPAYRVRTLLSWTQWSTAYFTVQGYTVWLPLLYVRLGGLPPSMAILLSIIPGVALVLMSYTLALTIDQAGRKPWFIGGFALGFVAMGCGAIAVSLGYHGWPVLFAVGFFTSIGVGVNAVGVYLYTPELFPTRMRAWATSTGSAANRIASAIAPIFVGLLLQHGLGIGSVFVMFAAVLLVGLVMMMWLGIETKNRVLEELSV